ncbi:Canalicular multispecific organic anion transporter 1 [Coemansia sp. RSA 1939]|nr:Canalicular multispecific organic anion transporter 1 [Coemansia sp. RSA 1939]
MKYHQDLEYVLKDINLTINPREKLGIVGRTGAGKTLLMRNRKIIVLDEATARVDQESDQDMQKLIRSEFKDCTVLTIAHRLKTIMGSDRIVVMDNGRVVEVGPPSELLEKGGYFAELVRANEF